jgi:DNA-binding CsgD family transcriptional regulator
MPSPSRPNALVTGLPTLIRLNPALSTVFFLQAFCALFFGLDALADLTGNASLAHLGESDVMEHVVTGVLIISLIFTGRQLWMLLDRQTRLEQQMHIASGAFAELLDAHFDDWGLTPSERDVALMAIKGLSIADMARLRETKNGTIKAQCNAVYRKAGVTGRPQLLSVFIEELMADGLNMQSTAS